MNPIGENDKGEPIYDIHQPEGFTTLHYVGVTVMPETPQEWKEFSGSEYERGRSDAALTTIIRLQTVRDSIFDRYSEPMSDEDRGEMCCHVLAEMEEEMKAIRLEVENG